MSKPTTRRGRPPVRPERAKSESLLLRMDPAEKKGFADAADLAGVPLSVWIRERLRAVAARELEATGRPVPFLS